MKQRSRVERLLAVPPPASLPPANSLEEIHPVIRENLTSMVSFALRIGAKGGNRTPTGVSPQDPESCASTKFRHFRGRNRGLYPCILRGVGILSSKARKVFGRE